MIIHNLFLSTDYFNYITGRQSNGGHNLRQLSELPTQAEMNDEMIFDDEDLAVQVDECTTGEEMDDEINEENEDFAAQTDQYPTEKVDGEFNPENDEPLPLRVRLTNRSVKIKDITIYKV